MPARRCLLGDADAENRDEDDADGTEPVDVGDGRGEEKAPPSEPPLSSVVVDAVLMVAPCRTTRHASGHHDAR
jgi:hypothetical protein